VEFPIYALARWLLGEIQTSAILQSADFVEKVVVADEAKS
jgi:hypothetical protein